MPQFCNCGRLKELADGGGGGGGVVVVDGGGGGGWGEGLALYVHRLIKR